MMNISQYYEQQFDIRLNEHRKTEQALNEKIQQLIKELEITKIKSSQSGEQLNKLCLIDKKVQTECNKIQISKHCQTESAPGSNNMGSQTQLQQMIDCTVQCDLLTDNTMSSTEQTLISNSVSSDTGRIFFL